MTRLDAPLLLALGALLPVLTACGGGEDPAPTGTPAEIELPAEIDLADPTDRVTRLEAVEDLTEAVADRLLAFSDKVRRRDFSAARDWFAPDFAGHALVGLPAAEESEPLDVTRTIFDAAAPPIVGRDDFLAGVQELIGPWARVESVLWKVKAAEFQKSADRWGKVKLYVHMTGTAANGGAESITGWGYARVALTGGDWVVTRFKLTSLDIARRDGSIFSEVTAAAGLGHVGTRFGQAGNRSFAFNGAACGDVDGDGRWDLFVPSDGRNFLYLLGADGRFREEAKERGVQQPDGGTGTVFLDFDRDGDQDLFVGHVDDGETGGTRLELYRNDGTGLFERVPGGLGLGAKELVAYSLVVLDYDLDGWPDLFVCGYGIVAREHNNSWIQATNGAPNALFRNVAGESFVDVAPELGIAGTSWTYAAAAADVDDDGDPDLYVANDYGTNELWRNDGGTFTQVADELGVLDQGNGMGATFGDLSGDGVLDLYVSNMSSTAGNRILDRYKDGLDPELYASLKKAAAGNTIFFQDAEGGFEKLPKSAGGVGGNWAWTAALVDLDLDGRLDVFCTNGFVTGDQPFDT